MPFDEQPDPLGEAYMEYETLKRKFEAMHAKVAEYADQIRYNVAHKYTTNAPQMMSMEDVWHMLQRIEEAGR